MTLRLASTAYAAEIDGALVFLDLRRDLYTYLAPEDARFVLPLLDGAAVQDEGDRPIARELMDAGLVTVDPEGKPFRRAPYTAVVEELPRMIGSDRPIIRSAHVWNFFCSVAGAAAMLRLLPLHRVVQLVRQQRRPRPDAGLSAAQLTDIYRRLRPLLFSRGDRCLLDSLGLIRFLGRYGLHPRWRFGVKLAPFQAHAWAQDGDLVLDDMATTIHSYTVILEA